MSDATAIEMLQELLDKGWRFEVHGGGLLQWEVELVGRGLANWRGCGSTFGEAAAAAIKGATAMEDDPFVVLGRSAVPLVRLLQECFGNNASIDINPVPQEHEFGPHVIMVEIVPREGMTPQEYVDLEADFHWRARNGLPEELWRAIRMTAKWPEETEPGRRPGAENSPARSADEHLSIAGILAKGIELMGAGWVQREVPAGGAMAVITRTPAGFKARIPAALIGIPLGEIDDVGGLVLVEQDANGDYLIRMSDPGLPGEAQTEEIRRKVSEHLQGPLRSGGTKIPSFPEHVFQRLSDEDRALVTRWIQETSSAVNHRLERLIERAEGGTPIPARSAGARLSGPLADCPICRTDSTPTSHEEDPSRRLDEKIKTAKTWPGTSECGGGPPELPPLEKARAVGDEEGSPTPMTGDPARSADAVRPVPITLRLSPPPTIEGIIGKAMDYMLELGEPAEIAFTGRAGPGATVAWTPRGITVTLDPEHAMIPIPEGFPGEVKRSSDGSITLIWVPLEDAITFSPARSAAREAEKKLLAISYLARKEAAALDAEAPPDDPQDPSRRLGAKILVERTPNAIEAEREHREKMRWTATAKPPAHEEDPARSAGGDSTIEGGAAGDAGASPGPMRGGNRIAPRAQASVLVTAPFPDPASTPSAAAAPDAASEFPAREGNKEGHEDYVAARTLCSAVEAFLRSIADGGRDAFNIEKLRAAFDLTQSAIRRGGR